MELTIKLIIIWLVLAIVTFGLFYALVKNNRILKYIKDEDRYEEL
jgi:hypothetical protein